MLKVIFPSGLTFQYNDASYLIRDEYSSLLYKSKKHYDENKGWICSVLNSSGAVIEAVAPCDITMRNPELDIKINKLLKLPIKQRTSRRIKEIFQ